MITQDEIDFFEVKHFVFSVQSKISVRVHTWYFGIEIGSVLFYWLF